MSMLGLKLIPYLDKDLDQRSRTNYDHVTSRVGVVITRLPVADYTLRGLTSSLPMDNKLVFHRMHTVNCFVQFLSHFSINLFF